VNEVNKNAKVSSALARFRPLNQLPRQSAFSLIEILVVLFILALLLGLTLPALARAREASRRTLCATNLRQFGLSIKSQSVDRDEQLATTIYVYNGRYPNFMRVAEGSEPASGPGSLESAGPPMGPGVPEWSIPGLAPYLPGANIPNRRVTGAWWCPSAAQDRAEEAREILWSNGLLMSSYSYFGRVGKWPAFATREDEITDEELAPGRLLMADTCYYWQMHAAWVYNHGSGAKYRDPALTPAIDGMNELYGDGHVAWVSPALTGSIPGFPAEDTMRRVKGGGQDACFY